MIWLVLIAVIITCSLLLYLVKYKQELKRLTEQLREITGKSTHKGIDISLVDNTLEELAIQINRVIDSQEKMYINARNEEQKLKESIANISHDLRTPLTSILGYTFLAQNSENQDVKTALEIIQRKAKSLDALINSFYELSLLDDDVIVLGIEMIDIVKVMTNCLMGSFNLFEKHGITPDIKIPEKAVLILGNELACERILQNLISNAIRYSKSMIRIELECSSTECTITIGNDTDLQDEEVASHLFDRFYTADRSRTSGSTGLGLYIVKVLLDKTGGGVKKLLLKDGMLFITISFPLMEERYCS